MAATLASAPVLCTKNEDPQKQATLVMSFGARVSRKNRISHKLLDQSPTHTLNQEQVSDVIMRLYPWFITSN